MFELHARPAEPRGKYQREVQKPAGDRCGAADAHHPQAELLAGAPQLLFRRIQLAAAAVRVLYANFEAGMIDSYLRDKDARDAALSLVAMERAIETR